MPRVVANAPQPLDAASKAESERVQVAFGKRLRDMRHAKLITIEQIAETAGLHPNYVGSVERGERNISLFNIWRLANSLNMDPAELMNELPKRKVAKSMR